MMKKHIIVKMWLNKNNGINLLNQSCLNIDSFFLLYFYFIKNEFVL